MCQPTQWRTTLLEDKIQRYKVVNTWNDTYSKVLLFNHTDFRHLSFDFFPLHPVILNLKNVVFSLHSWTVQMSLSSEDVYDSWCCCVLVEKKILNFYFKVPPSHHKCWQIHNDKTFFFCNFILSLQSDLVFSLLNPWIYCFWLKK